MSGHELTLSVGLAREALSLFAPISRCRRSRATSHPRRSAEVVSVGQTGVSMNAFVMRTLHGLPLLSRTGSQCALTRPSWSMSPKHLAGERVVLVGQVERDERRRVAIRAGARRPGAVLGADHPSTQMSRRAPTEASRSLE
jgi:hypothetical protein